MLTYVPAESQALNHPEQKEQPWLLFLLCAIWLIPGLLGHDPWKPAENQTVAIIDSLLREPGWTLPSLAGRPWLENGPLYYWVAALLARLLGWFGLVLHDAVRVSSGIWMAFTLWGVGLAGRELHGRRQGRVAVVALIGSVGLLLWSHHAAPAVLALAAFAWQLYALALVRRRPLPAGCLLGFSWLLLLLGASWAEAILAILCALSLPLNAGWRRSSYLAALLAAFTIALPLGGLWPLWLYQHAHSLFSLWWDKYSLGLYGGLGNWHLFHQPGYLPSIVVWFAFPVLPLAIWTSWLNRNALGEGRWFLLLSQSLWVALWLLLAGEPGEAQALLLLVPLAVFAAAGVDSLRRGAASSLYWFGTLTFGCLALIFWLGWLVLMSGMPGQFAIKLHSLSPSYTPSFGLGAIFALVLSVAWIKVLLGKRPFGRRAMTAWACGVTLVWGVLVGLWQPWLDASKTYRVVGEGVRDAAKPYPGCILAPQVGPAQLGGVSYYSGRKLVVTQSEADTLCPLQLIQAQQPLVGENHSLIWQGNRPGEHGERFFLYRTHH